MYDHTLYLGRKHFCCYFLHAFSAENVILKTALKLVANKGLYSLKQVSVLMKVK